MTNDDKMTAQQYREQVAASRTCRRSKYGAKRVGDHASKKEHRRALQLKMMLRAGLIADLREQVSFTLVPSQLRADGTKEYPVRYIADFVYLDCDTGHTVVEDTKGYRTPEYIIKRKLMLMVHGITIKEV